MLHTFSCMLRKEQPKRDIESARHGAFKLEYLKTTKPIFEKGIFAFIKIHLLHLPFTACRKKDTQQWTKKLKDAKGCMAMGHQR